MNNAEILVIDDEPQIRKLLQISLEGNAYKVILASYGVEGLNLAAHHTPALIILDLDLPDIHGQKVLIRLREWYNHPIIILSVINQEEDIIAALDAGATDYLCKPFRTGELLARIRSALRHSEGGVQKFLYEFGDLIIDLSAYSVRLNGQIIKLTVTEFKLLALLARNEGRVLTHKYLLKEIWGLGYQNETQYLRVFVAQLRKKLEQDPDHPRHIITESGVGYRFQ